MKHVAVALGAILLIGASRPAATPRWAASWASAQQLPEPANALDEQDRTDSTLRQVVRLSVGGTRLRVRLSNAFGIQPLVVDTVRVAFAARGASIVTASTRAATFGGKPSVTIPAGAEYWSDPIDMPAPALSRLAISMYLPMAPASQTGHPGSRSTSYVVHGNHSGDADLTDAKSVVHWYQLAGVEVSAAAGSATIAAFGDSITDGHGATTDGDDRWPDVLAARLQASAATRRIGVVNAGIGGNRMLNDGSGPNALARFDCDVLSQAGIGYVILLEGVNDLGTATREHAISPAAHAELVDRLIGAYAQIVARAHAHGIRVIGATILPFVGSDYYHPGAETEADRSALNAWIRGPGHFDAVIDFDRIVRDPAHPDRLAPSFDSGDHLHPSAAGYRAMAQAIPLTLFRN